MELEAEWKRASGREKMCAETSHPQRSCGPLDVGDVAAAVAERFGDMDTQRKVGRSMWARNNALRCVGVGDGVTFTVADGELLLVCAEDHALGLPIAGESIVGSHSRGRTEPDARPGWYCQCKVIHFTSRKRSLRWEILLNLTGLLFESLTGSAGATAVPQTQAGKDI